MTNQSQKHGFDMENSIRTNVFHLKEVSNDTNTHDIPCSQNPFDPGENISIKCSGGTRIECGDIQRFYNYDFTKKNTIIFIHWEQNTDTTKIIKRIYEIDYNQLLHTHLFGTITLKKIEEYVRFIKSIPPGQKAQKQYKVEREDMKRELQQIHNMTAVIHPKVDSKKQRRVQCSFNIMKIPAAYITYTSPEETPSLLRKIELPLTFESCRRKFNNKLK